MNIRCCAEMLKTSVHNQIVTSTHLSEKENKIIKKNKEETE
jgi:hypothetical protein